MNNIYIYILNFQACICNFVSIELKIYLFLKTVEQSKQFEHEQIWISRIGGTTRSLGAWKVKSSYKVKFYAKNMNIKGKRDIK